VLCFVFFLSDFTSSLIACALFNTLSDINECELRKQSHELSLQYPCSSDGICKNREGGYDCRCKSGMKGDAIKGNCSEKFPLPAKVVVGKKLSTNISIFI
jgi:hypothetical protein